MCLHRSPVDPVTEEATSIARAAFPKGTTYMTLRDALGAIFEDEDFTHLFPSRGHPRMAPLQGSVSLLEGNDIEPGGNWPPTLSEALGRSKVFVPIYPPTYFAKEYCGRG
jgi:hypothetical protein